MKNEEEVKAIVKKVLDEEHLLGFVKIFEKEHNLFRGSHDKIGLPEALSIPREIVTRVTEGLIRPEDVYEHIGGKDDAIIDTEAIADAAIETAKIANAAIEEGKLATGSVSAAKIVAGAILAVKIATGAVTTIKLDALAVTAAKIAALAIETGKIAANAITAGKIAANAIETDKIKALAITAAKIAAGTITAAEINLADFMKLPSDGDLAGYWSFDEGSGDLAVDGSGRGNDGSLENMAENDWLRGKVGMCLSFDGVNDYVDCGNDSSLDLDVFSACSWIKTTGTGYKMWMSRGGAQYWLAHHTSRLCFTITTTTGRTNLYTTVNYYDDKWHFIVNTYDGEAMRVYMDGEEIDSVAKTGTISGLSNLLIGKYSAPTYVFTGKIDEVRLYNRALTAAEIKALYLYPAGNKAVRISGGQIAANTITAAQILAGSITAEEITAGTITADELILGQRQYWYSIPSDNTRKSNNTERSTPNNTYTKLKETRMNVITGKMRIYFQMKGSDQGRIYYAKIYKNGVAIGTERSTVSSSYETFTEDLGGFVEGDLIQIYAKRHFAATTVYIENFRFRYDRAVSITAGHELVTGLPTVDQTIFSMTNQDP